MVPAAVVVIEQMPNDEQRKLDRGRLPKRRSDSERGRRRRKQL